MIQNKIKRLNAKCLQLNYSIWYKSLIIERKNYLRRIGIMNEKKLRVLSSMKFHLLPYDIRSELQTREITA